MYNEEVTNDYTEAGENDINANNVTDSQLEYEDEEEYLKVRKEHVFGEIDYTKRKCKIICTLG